MISCRQLSDGLHRNTEIVPESQSLFWLCSCFTSFVVVLCHQFLLPNVVVLSSCVLCHFMLFCLFFSFHCDCLPSLVSPVSCSSSLPCVFTSVYFPLFLCLCSFFGLFILPQLFWICLYVLDWHPGFDPCLPQLPFCLINHTQTLLCLRRLQLGPNSFLVFLALDTMEKRVKKPKQQKSHIQTLTDCISTQVLWNPIPKFVFFLWFTKGYNILTFPSIILIFVYFKLFALTHHPQLTWRTESKFPYLYALPSRFSIITWLMMMTTDEQSHPCCTVFVLYFWANLRFICLHESYRQWLMLGCFAWISNIKGVWTH